MPIILAVTAAKRFKTNIYLAIVLVGAMMYPNIIDLANAGTSVKFLGIPVTLLNYSSTVIPAIAAVLLLSVVERFLTKYVPNSVRTFIIPALSLVIVLPVSLIVIGPIVTVIANGLAYGFTVVNNFSPVVAGALLGGLWQIFVVFGVHWTFVPFVINNISVYGYDATLAFVGPSNFAQAGASLGVFLKTKNPQMKQVAGSAAISGIFGITEPTIYGVTLKNKKVFVIAMIFSAIAGGMVGVFGCAANSVALLGLLTLPVYAVKNFGMFLVTCAIAYFGTAIVTFLFGYKENNGTEKQGDK